MPLNLFKFLLAHLRFDDKATREERWKQDRFAAMREIFQIFSRNCERVLVPDDLLFLDETLYPTRVEWHFDSTTRANLKNMDYFLKCKQWPHFLHLYCHSI